MRNPYEKNTGTFSKDSLFHPVFVKFFKNYGKDCVTMLKSMQK